MEVVTSRSNPTLKAVRKLRTRKGRRASGQSFVEGPKLLDELVASGLRPDHIVAVESDLETVEYGLREHIRCVVASPDVFVTVADAVTPQSPVAVFTIPMPGDLRTVNTVVLFDVADPGNVGTLIRTAHALGWDVALAGDSADPWSPKALRAAAGTTFHTTLAFLEDASHDIRHAGLLTVATVVDGGVVPTPLNPPIALLVGSEAHGLPDELLASAAHWVTIPMRTGTESLNAAMAAGIAMYALSVDH